MKKFLTVIIVVPFLSFVATGQSFECGESNERITISNVVCNDNGTPDDPSDDYLSFTVTGENVSSNSVISNLPLGVHDDELNPEYFSDFDCFAATCDINVNSLTLPATINVPSPGCAPLDIEIHWARIDGFPLPDEGCTFPTTLMAQPPANIPALQTWGILILGLLFAILGFLVLKGRILEFRRIKMSTG